MKKYSFIAFMIFGVAILSGLCSCNNVNQNKLSVGVHSWPGGGMVYIGEKMGFFKEEGIDLSIKKIENFDVKRASMVSGEIDIDVANTLDQLLIYNENNFPAQVIGITDESDGGDGLISSDTLTDIAQLKGKTIAYAEASPSDFLLRYLLKMNNIDLASVHFKPVSDPQVAGNAVIARQVDAAVTYEPWLSQAGKVKGLKVLVSTKQYPTLIPGLLIANATKVTANKDLYKRFLTAWFKSVDYYYSHKDEAQQIIAEGMGMKPADVKDILSVVDIQQKAGDIRLFDKSTPNNLYQLLSSINVFWIDNGFVKKTGDVDKMINQDLIKNQ